MRAVIVRERGGPEVLSAEDREVPAPGPGELLVKAAAGVDFMDVCQRRGRPPNRVPLPYTPGW